MPKPKKPAGLAMEHVALRPSATTVGSLLLLCPAKSSNSECFSHHRKPSGKCAECQLVT